MRAIALLSCMGGSFIARAKVCEALWRPVASVTDAVAVSQFQIKSLGHIDSGESGPDDMFAMSNVNSCSLMCFCKPI